MHSQDPRLTILKNIPREIYTLNDTAPVKTYYVDRGYASQVVEYQYHQMYDLDDIYVTITHRKEDSWYFVVQARYQGTIYEPKNCPDGFLKDISYKIITYLRLMGLYTDD